MEQHKIQWFLKLSSLFLENLSLLFDVHIIIRYFQLAMSLKHMHVDVMIMDNLGLEAIKNEINTFLL